MSKKNKQDFKGQAQKPKDEEKLAKEPTQKPIQKPVEKPKETPKVSKPTSDTYGKAKIEIIGNEKKKVNDVIYNEVYLRNGTTILASDKEFNKNLNLE